MNVDIKNNQIIFKYENEYERLFIHNLLEFSKNILNEQKEFHNVSKDLKPLLKKAKKEILISEGNIDKGNLEVIEFLLDNTNFLIKTMEEKPKDFEIIERVSKEILEGIKANK